MDTTPIDPQKPTNEPILVQPKRRPRKQKLTILLGSSRITIDGIEPKMEALLATLGEAGRHAAAAHKQGIKVPTFLAICRDRVGG